MGNFTCLTSKSLLNTNPVSIILIGQSKKHIFPLTNSNYCPFCRKKGQNKKLQETYIKLKIEGKEVISGVYSKAAENEVNLLLLKELCPF